VNTSTAPGHHLI